MARKAKARKTRKRVAQLKVRLPEPLRRQLERAAAQSGHSMNVEAVKRLTESFHLRDQTELIVDMLLRNLDDAVIERLVDKVLRDRGMVEIAEEEQLERAQDYAEALAEMGALDDPEEESK